MTNQRPFPDSPFAVAYGMGVDSTAMLVGLRARGIRPHKIQFADTGGEKPETYAYLPVIQSWLQSASFPQVDVVSYKPTRAPYTTLEGKCEANQTLPSLAFGGKSCSIVFKAEVQDKAIRGKVKRHKGQRSYEGGWTPAHEAWAARRKVVKAIGYDAGPADSRRSKIKDDKEYTYWYPLRDWGWTRDRCIEEIKGAGLPVPVKSACWFCPASKKAEVEWLGKTHPHLFARGVAMEDLARNGKHGLGSTKGLGRSWSWREFGEERGLVERRPDGRVGLAVSQEPLPVIPACAGSDPMCSYA